MSQESVRALSPQSDEEIAALGRKYGLLPLACEWEGLPLTESYKTTDFSRENPYVHHCWREGHVGRVTRERMPEREEPACIEVKGDGKLGSVLPITETVFKGE